MNILIADDNRLVRFSLKSMLLDIITDDCAIYEAANGIEMLELCSMHRPNIAFVDIDMPRLDGISAIKACQDSSPETYFVILTGYSDFSYAQECVSLNIYAYVLKPIDTEQLRVLYNKLCNVLSHDRRLYIAHFQAKIIQLFNLLNEVGFNVREAIDEYEYFKSIKNEYLGALFFIDCANPLDYPSVYKALFRGLNELGESLIGKEYYYAVFPFSEASLAFVLGGERMDEALIAARTRLICERSSISADRKLAHISCMFSVSGSIAAIFEQCSMIDENKYLRLGLFPSDVKKLDFFDDHSREFLLYIQDLLNYYMLGDELEYARMIECIDSSVKNVSRSILEAAASNISFATGREFDHLNLRSFCRSLRLAVSEMFEGLRKTADKIDLVIDYVEKNYMHNISINEIAEHLGLTPNYLSKMFREKKQMRFIDYLTEVRVQNAKKILSRTTDISIKNLALMVGYYSPRYFSRVFKKITGYYPSEFKK